MDSINKWLALAANLGVIAGIVFLALEIDQNNEQLAAQTRNTMYELRDSLDRDYINNEGDLAEIAGKETRGDVLTDVERSRPSRQRFWTVRTFGHMVIESREIAVAEVRYISSAYDVDPRLVTTWERLHGNGVLAPEFVTFMEDHVLPLLNQ